MLKSTILTALLCAGFASAYIVKNGDTIWDLSAKELRDPFAWGQIWQVNPQVKNPNQIYPGQKLNLPQARVMPEDDGVQIQVANKNKAQAEQEFKRRLGPLAKDPSHRPLTFVPPKADLRAAPSTTTWLNRSLQLQTPFWVHATSAERTFAEEYYPQSAGVVNGQVVQLGQYYTVHEKLSVNQYLELYESGEAKVVQPSQVKVAHKPMGFAKVVEVKDNDSKIKVDYLLGELRVAKLMARPNPNRFPVEIKSYRALNEIDFSQAAQIEHFMQNKMVVSTGDWALLNQGVNQGFDVGDAIVIWDRTPSDTNSLAPVPVAYGVVLHADAVGSTIYIKEFASMKQMPALGQAVTVYAKALK